jgi:hypothetical protein
MQTKDTLKIAELVTALIAGLIVTSSAYMSRLLIDRIHLEWTVSREVAFVALIVGVVSLVLMFGVLEVPSKEETSG